MKKKILSITLVVCLLATALVSGTLAYFTDSEKATNTMVIGNVDIDIDELAYDKTTGTWSKFVDDKFVVYPQTKKDGSLNYNKMVYTFNNSANDQAAYIRNIILVEVPEGKVANDKIMFLYTNDDAGDKHGAVEIDSYTGSDLIINDVHYHAYVYTDKDYEPIPSGHYLSTLSSVWMVDTATNADAAKYGKQVDIITFSQAIQSEGFEYVAGGAYKTQKEAYDAAMKQFGDLTAKNIISWVTGAEEATINDHFSQYE